MTPMRIVYEAHGRPEHEHLEEIPLSGSRICALCRQWMPRGGVPVKKAVSGTFTNWDAFAGESTHLCPACAFVFQQKLRRTSFLCTPVKFTPLKRDQIADVIFGGDEWASPFVFCVTSTYKKHLLYRADVNYDRRRFSITFDDVNIHIDADRDRAVRDAVAELYSTFAKEEIEHGTYKLSKLMKVDMDRFSELEAVVAEVRDRRPHLLKFILFIANKEEREWGITKKPETPNDRQENQPQLF